jgi:glycosyltransferase involved in cell wall biosynthesis
MASFSTGAACIANILLWSVGKKKVPLVLSLQEGDSESYLKFKWGGLIGLSWRLALQRTEHLVVISTYLLQRARRLGYRGPASVIPNGVNVGKFRNDEPKVFNPDKILLITTSRLVPKNGAGDVIAALSLLPQSVHFKILGVGPLETQLKTQVQKLGLVERVIFGGFVDQTELPEHLHAADIFIRPSLSEGMGNSFIEAMAAGLPVIATPVGGIPDFLQDGVTGVFCEPKHPESVARAVERVIGDESLRQGLIRNAFEMVQEKYDWALIAEDMKNKVFLNV